MAKNNKEYRGKVLPELEGKSHFVCEICGKKRAMLTLDIHHIKPQAFFDKDSDEVDARENLLVVENGCHTATHRIAASLAGLGANKKSAYELAQDFASGIVEGDDVGVVASNILKYAVIVAQATVMKRSKAIAGNDVETVLTLPPKLNALFKSIGKTIKDGKGRALGKERLLNMAALDLIMRHRPETRDEITQYIFTEILKNDSSPTVFRNSQIQAQRM